MNNEHHTPQLPELKPVFRIKRTEVWDLAREALHQASPDGLYTNYAQAMSLLTHGAAFVAELAMVNARNADELQLVEDCVDLHKLEFSRMMETIGKAADAKRTLMTD